MNSKRRRKNFLFKVVKVVKGLGNNCQKRFCDFNLEINIENIKTHINSTPERLLNRAFSIEAMQRLNNLKENPSKARNISHS